MDVVNANTMIIILGILTCVVTVTFLVIMVIEEVMDIKDRIRQRKQESKR